MRYENHVIEIIPAYVLDCLEEEETILVSQHLSICERCRSEFETYQEVVDQLPFAAPDTEPDPAVKEGLMERIRSEESVASERERHITLWQKISIAMGRWSPAWALTSLILIIFLTASNIFLWQRVNRLQNTPRSVAMRTIDMSGTDTAPLASGLIVVSSDGDHGTLVVENLPTLGDENQYQLWLIKNGARTSGGVFSVGEDGYGSVWVSSPQPLSDYSSFGVTIEPAGGSPGPTGDKVLGSET